MKIKEEKFDIGRRITVYWNAEHEKKREKKGMIKEEEKEEYLKIRTVLLIFLFIMVSSVQYAANVQCVLVF